MEVVDWAELWVGLTEFRLSKLKTKFCLNKLFCGKQYFKLVHRHASVLTFN